MLSGVQTGNGTPHDKYNMRGIAHVRTNRKDDIFMQRRLVQNFTFILEWRQGTCSLTKHTWRWTYSALRYFFPACCQVHFTELFILKTVKEALAECRSFFDVVVIFPKNKHCSILYFVWVPLCILYKQSSWPSIKVPLFVGGSREVFRNIPGHEIRVNSFLNILH